MATNLVPEKPLTKAQITARLHAELGKCMAMTQSKGPKQCSRWAASRVGVKAFCDQHAGSIIEAQRDAAKTAAKRAELEMRLDDYLDWVKDHPSVWDRRVTESPKQS